MLSRNRLESSGGSSVRGRTESFSSIVPHPSSSSISSAANVPLVSTTGAMHAASMDSPTSLSAAPHRFSSNSNKSLYTSGPLARPSFDYKPRQSSTDALFANINNAALDANPLGKTD